MKTLVFHYHMDITFTAAVCGHSFTLKCVPQTDDRQTITDLDIKVRPHDWVGHGTDGFGNVTIYGHKNQAHNHFYCDVKGEAQMVVSPSPRMEPTLSTLRYMQQSSMTKLGHGLFAYLEELDCKGSNLQVANRIMQDLYAEKIQYVQGSTNVDTTAEQAFQLGQGVCQDYAHILIALCRGAGIPARYVAGFLVGEGYSHGWVEVFQPVDETQGYWIPLDPTNQLQVTDQHIKIAVGRDARDCQLNRGIFRGNGCQIQWSSVIVYNK